MKHSAIMDLGKAMNQASYVTIEYWTANGFETRQFMKTSEVAEQIDLNVPLCSLSLWF